MSPIPEGLIFWDSEHDDRAILNRAKAGIVSFLNRSYYYANIVKRENDPTGYIPGRGYHDYNLCVDFSFYTKNNEYGASRMAYIQGSWVFHVTNSGGLQIDDYNTLRYPHIPVMCVTSGSDKTSATLFTGKQVNKIALDLLKRSFFERSIKGEKPYDDLVYFYEDWRTIIDATLRLDGSY